MSSTFKERVASRSQLTAAFQQEGGTARATYTVANSGAGMWGGPGDSPGESVITEILGTATVGTRRLYRVMPLAHPLFPWMYAYRIASIQGIGKPSSTQASGDGYEVDTITATTASYPYYEIVVEFAPRMYAVTEDEMVDNYSLTWYNTDGTTTTTQVYREWARFTDYEIRPAPEIITGQQGQSYFVKDLSAISPFTTADRPHSQTFQGLPRIVSPRAQIVFKWMQVPFSYIDSGSSFIMAHIGKINQNAWYGWPAGSLLYEGVNVRRYTPPAPQLRIPDDALDTTAQKLCDIEFNFTYVKRSQSSVPSLSGINGSWVAAGHNLLPWFGDREFYYAIYPDQSDLADTSTWYPTYESVPFEILFQNPDWA